ncbi:MAG TPA: hypothetical protein VGM34_04285, partial [Chlamydiales bacterium]
MHYVPEFVHRFKESAQKLRVKEPLFSRSTYQYEVQEGKKNYFPFLQFSEDAILSDSFCTCKVSESGQGCPHLAASYMAIFHGHEEPLHKRFAISLWNVLCDLASDRNGYGTDCLKEKAGGYECVSDVGKKLFSIIPKTEAAKKRLKNLVTKRVVETEETSIKFSNLSSEEITQYKMGRGSHQLKYELSFWSDLAKWLMFLSDGAYEVSFEGEKLPTGVRVEFPDLVIWFFIAEMNLPLIIPALATVRS